MFRETIQRVLIILSIIFRTGFLEKMAITHIFVPFSLEMCQCYSERILLCWQRRNLDFTALVWNYIQNLVRKVLDKVRKLWSFFFQFSVECWKPWRSKNVRLSERWASLRMSFRLSGKCHEHNPSLRNLIHCRVLKHCIYRFVSKVPRPFSVTTNQSLVFSIHFRVS